MKKLRAIFSVIVFSSLLLFGYGSAEPKGSFFSEKLDDPSDSLKSNVTYKKSKYEGYEIQITG
jgi:hypothetical protein